MIRRKSAHRLLDTAEKLSFDTLVIVGDVASK